MAFVLRESLAFEQYALGAFKIDVRGCDIVETLATLGMVVVLDESRDLVLEIEGCR